jgi:hypothetical protein
MPYVKSPINGNIIEVTANSPLLRTWQVVSGPSGSSTSTNTNTNTNTNSSGSLYDAYVAAANKPSQQTTPPPTSPPVQQPTQTQQHPTVPPPASSAPAGTPPVIAPVADTQKYYVKSPINGNIIEVTKDSPLLKTWQVVSGPAPTAPPAPVVTPPPAPVVTPPPAPVEKVEAPTATGTPSDYGSSIENFDPSNPFMKKIADLGQQWKNATSQAEKDRIAAESKQIGEAAGGHRSAAGKWTFPTTSTDPGIPNISVPVDAGVTGPVSIDTPPSPTIPPGTTSPGSVITNPVELPSSAAEPPLPADYGSSINNFNYNDPIQRHIADLGQQWKNAKTQADKDRIAKEALDYGTANGGKRDASGHWTFGGGSTGTGAGTGTGTGTGTTEAAAPTDQNDLIKIILDMLTGNQQSEADMQAQAQAQAEAQAKEQRDALTNLINSLNANQEADLSRINSGLANTKQDLQDKTFQDYLQARQAMANRGLAGSGLANDQDTRLLLSQGRTLARANQDALAQAQKVAAGYSQSLADARTKFANVNTSQIAQQLFQKMYESGSKNMTDRAKAMIDLLGKTMGYNTDMGNLQFKYDQLGQQDKQFYDKLDSNEKIAYAKMDNSNQQLAAKLSQEYNLKMTQFLGYDPTTGQPTIDSLKLAESVRHNQASEVNSANAIIERANSNKAKLDQDMNEFIVKASQNADKLQSSQWSQQAKNLATIIKQKGTEITTYTTQLTKLDPKSATYDHDKQVIQSAIADALGTQNAYAKVLDDLTFAKLPGQTGVADLLKTKVIGNGGGGGGHTYNPN